MQAALSIYAAAIATVALAWQVFSVIRARREAAGVSVGLSPSGNLAAHYLVIEVVNHGSVPLHVRSVGLAHEISGSGGGVSGIENWPPPPEATIPGVVEPYGSGWTFKPHTPTNMSPSPTAHIVVQTPRKTFRSRSYEIDNPGLFPDVFRFIHELPREIDESTPRPPSELEEYAAPDADAPAE